MFFFFVSVIKFTSLMNARTEMCSLSFSWLHYSHVFLLFFSSMTLVPQLSPPTLCRAVLLLMTNVPTWSRFPPVAKRLAVVASGAPLVVCVNQGLRDHSVIKVGIDNYFQLAMRFKRKYFKFSVERAILRFTKGADLEGNSVFSLPHLLSCR